MTHDFFLSYACQDNEQIAFVWDLLELPAQTYE